MAEMASRARIWRGMPLRQRLFISALIGTVPLILLGIMLLITNYYSRRSLILQANQEVARLASVYLEGWVNGNISTLRTLAGAAEVKNGNAAEAQALVERQLAAQPEWDNLYITDADGQIIAGNVTGDVYVGDRAYFIQARDTERPAVSNLLTSRATGNTIVGIAYPIIDEGVFEGIISASFRPETIQEIFEQLQAPEETVLVLWGGDGEDIAAINLTVDPATLFPPEVLDNIIVSDEPGTLITPSPGKGARLLVGFAPVAGTPWVVSVATPLLAAMTPVYLIMFIFVSVALVVVVLTLWWTTYSTNLISQQINSLVQAAQAIGAGDLSARVSLQEGGELGDLANSLNKMAGDLALLGRMKSDLLGLVSHELRTPLTTIRSFLDLLAAGTLSTDYPGYPDLLDSATRQARRLQDMIDNLLNAARSDIGVLTVTPRTTRLASIFATSVRTYEGIIREHELAFTVEVPEDLCVEAESAKMTLAINNLLDNAVKYTPSGSVTLTARAQGDDVRIAVTDTGIGFSSEVKPHLFERFYQAEPLLTREAGGAGLGLPVVKAIAEAHGGRVFAESEGEGRGSTIGFTLPRVPCNHKKGWGGSIPRPPHE